MNVKILTSILFTFLCLYIFIFTESVNATCIVKLQTQKPTFKNILINKLNVKDYKEIFDDYDRALINESVSFAAFGKDANNGKITAVRMYFFNKEKEGEQPPIAIERYIGKSFVSNYFAGCQLQMVVSSAFPGDVEAGRWLGFTGNGKDIAFKLAEKITPKREKQEVEKTNNLNMCIVSLPQLISNNIYTFNVYALKVNGIDYRSGGLYDLIKLLMEKYDFEYLSFEKFSMEVMAEQSVYNEMRRFVNIDNKYMLEILKNSNKPAEMNMGIATVVLDNNDLVKSIEK